MPRSPDDYEVGYKKPPKNRQFVPGQSGNQRRRKKHESQAEIIARLRDERVDVNGRAISKFEIAVMTTINSTIRSGKTRDLKVLLELLDKYGALPAEDSGEKARAGAEAVYNKMMNLFYVDQDIDPEDIALVTKLEADETSLIMGCARCAPALKQRWALPEREALRKRHGTSRLHDQVITPDQLSYRK